jgi:N-ethylmaleimide reductase
MATYYGQRASAGLIVTEATQVMPGGQGYPCTPGIYTAEQIAGWKTVTAAVHAAGGTIVVQLWHVGRISHPTYQPHGIAPAAPSAIMPTSGEVFTYDGPKPFETPRALEEQEIVEIVAAYRHAARSAREAGFDGVEIHAANGYLIDQFLRDGTNKRTDRYGGSAHNRCRFLCEVTDAVLQEWQADRVGVRISPNGTFNDMSDSDPKATFKVAIDGLRDRKLAYLHFIERMAQDPAIQVSLAEVRSWFTGSVIVNGGYTQERADTVLSEGLADLVAFGVPFIANPDLVERMARHAPLNSADPSIFYGGDHRGYTDYPTL